MALTLQMFIMLKGVESQVSTSSSSVSYASVTGHASSAPQLLSVSAAVTTSSKPLLSSTLTTTAATTGITPLPSVTLSSLSAESQVTTSYASVTGHASSASQLPSVSVAITTSSKSLLSSTLTTTAATPGITPLPSVTLLSSSAESQVTTSYASATGHASSAPQLPSVSVAVTTSSKPLLSSTLTTTSATPGTTVTLLSSSAESQVTTSYASVIGHASSAPQLPSVSAAVTTSTKPSSVFLLSPSKRPLFSSTLATTTATPGITSSPSVTLSSSSIPQTSELTKSSPGISLSSVSSDVKPTDPTTSLSDTTPRPSPTSALLSSPNVSSTPLPQKPQKPRIYIKIFFSMPWGRFCYLTSLFKESLSRNLLEFDGVTWQYMPLERIRLYNAKEKCANKSLYYNKDATLELFIARMGEENNAHKNKTIDAFELLYDYWTNKRMILLDPVFEGKVTKVEIVGVDEDKYIPEYTEAQRIGIAIGVALAILVVVLIVIYFVKRYMTTHQARPKPLDGKMVITNEHAFEETTASDLTNTASKPLETQEEMSEVPEQVVVHKQPSPAPTKKSKVDVKVEDKTPLLSEIKDYEDGKSGGETKSDQEASETEASLEPKPEPEDFDGRPIKPPRSDSMIDAEIVLPESISQISKVLDTEEQVKNEEGGIEPVQTVEEKAEPGKNEEEGTEPGKTEEEGKEEQRPSFTSSVTVNIRPEAATTSKEFDYPAKEQPPDTQTDNNNQAPTGDDDVSEDEKVKPDFGQSDSGDADPNEGAINLGFDDDEAQKEEKKKEEETKF
ncbi:hypothetical protein ABFA07_001495 [Porites harrisoni]